MAVAAISTFPYTVADFQNYREVPIELADQVYRRIAEDHLDRIDDFDETCLTILDENGGKF